MLSLSKHLKETQIYILKELKSKPHVMREVFLCLFLLSVGLSFSQNKANQIFSSEGISEIIINGDQIFNIEIETTDTNEIEVTSLTSGEYQNYFQVTSKVKNGQLFIDLIQNPLTHIEDDKRNANKMVSASVSIILPKQLSLSLKSDVGSADIKGVFKKLQVNLLQGTCSINGIVQEAIIKTTTGNINAITNNAIIQTDSKSGLVSFPSDMIGYNVWRLTTTSGNITVKRPE